ncbi:MAG: copper resistance protein CopC [Gammaproteobacteria bacterium]|nr:copper resistance protein CopC [Gammaproteobacteria bacterium]
MRLLRSAIMAVLVMLTGTAAVLAHARMVASVPRDGTTVAAGLSEIELSFSKPMRLTLVRVHPLKGGDDAVLTGSLPAAFANAVTVGFAALGPGAYAVSWTGVAEDGHVMKGSFAFSVAAPQ